MYQLIGGLVFAGLLLAMLVIIVVQRTRRNRILAEMNTIKDKFFSIISHDLKNPAIAQRNALKTLMTCADKWDANTISDYSQKLYQSADELVEFLKNLLNWAQIQTKRETYRPASFNLVESLQRDINIIKTMAENKNITFQTQLPEEAVITGDENMIITVIRNLLANAVKFTASGGTITLDIAGDCVSVTDTGIGMSPEQMRNLFRIDAAHSQQGTAGEKGTGLGLIVCKEMLEKHGSALHVECAEGKGCRFWFEI